MLTSQMSSATSPPPKFHPGVAVRLPVSFAVAPLLTEISALSDAAWRAHFNTGYHDGGWTGIALLSVDGAADTLYIPRDGAQSSRVSPTRWAALCPQLMASIGELPCAVHSARLLRLAAGAVIREHSDDDLCWADGVARLHVPLLTHDRVEFYVDQQRVVMAAGECWYLDLSRPHRVQNVGSTDRVHLVLDCTVNDWLLAQVQSAAATSQKSPANAPLAESGASQFERFRNTVFADGHLQQQLRMPATLDELMPQVVAAGALRGFTFSVEDVRAQSNQAHRDWIEQWIM